MNIWKKIEKEVIMKILIVEDQKELADLLVKRLKSFFSADVCTDGQSALDYVNTYTYSALILDIMLPKVDGFTVVRKIRNSGNDVPILLLTARGDLEDRVKGLNAGADDYLVKPFEFDELLARLLALVRRSRQKTSPSLKVGDLELDTIHRRVTRQGIEIRVTGKEYMLLEFLMYHPNMLLTRYQLEQQVWDSDFEGTSNILDVYIRHLRKKIDDDFEEKMIETVRGQGYRLRGKKE